MRLRAPAQYLSAPWCLLCARHVPTPDFISFLRLRMRLDFAFKMLLVSFIFFWIFRHIYPFPFRRSLRRPHAQPQLDTTQPPPLSPAWSPTLPTCSSTTAARRTTFLCTFCQPSLQHGCAPAQPLPPTPAPRTSAMKPAVAVAALA